MKDFMYALSTLTNQAEALKNTQKSVQNGQSQGHLASDLIDIGMFSCLNRIRIGLNWSSDQLILIF